MVGVVGLVVAGIAVFILLNNQPQVKHFMITPEIQKCAEEKLSSLKGTYPGKINIRFESGIVEDSAKELISSYGLSASDTGYVRLDNSYFITVDVPKGQEFEWMCEFEKSEIVSFSTNVIWGGTA